MAQASGSFRDIQVFANQIQVRKISVADLWQSLREGYGDFVAKPTYGVFLLITYPLFALLLTLFMLGDELLHLAFPMVAGFTLLGPMLSVALFEMSRQRERGLEPHWRSAFDFVHTSAFAPIVALALVMMVLYVAWLYMAQFIYFGAFLDNPPATFGELINALFSTRQGASVILYGVVIGFLFAATALAISVIGFPLLLDRPATCATAISTSVRAVTANPFVMAVWGVTVVVLLTVGAALFLVGLAAILPILGHSTWHLYRKVVEAESSRPS